MSEKPPYEKSMIGRQVDADGRDHGDVLFFQRDMNFTEKTETQEMVVMRSEEVDHAIVQVESIAERDCNIGATAYDHLINLYPDDPRVAEWRRRLEELKTGK